MLDISSRVVYTLVDILVLHSHQHLHPKIIITTSGNKELLGHPHPKIVIIITTTSGNKELLDHPRVDIHHC